MSLFGDVDIFESYTTFNEIPTPLSPPVVATLATAVFTSLNTATAAAAVTTTAVPPSSSSSSSSHTTSHTASHTASHAASHGASEEDQGKGRGGAGRAGRGRGRGRGRGKGTGRPVKTAVDKEDKEEKEEKEENEGDEDKEDGPHLDTIDSIDPTGVQGVVEEDAPIGGETPVVGVSSVGDSEDAVGDVVEDSAVSACLDAGSKEIVVDGNSENRASSSSSKSDRNSHIDSNSTIGGSNDIDTDNGQIGASSDKTTLSAVRPTVTVQSVGLTVTIDKKRKDRDMAHDSCNSESAVPILDSAEAAPDLGTSDNDPAEKKRRLAAASSSSSSSSPTTQLSNRTRGTLVGSPPLDEVAPNPRATRPKPDFNLQPALLRSFCRVIFRLCPSTLLNLYPVSSSSISVLYLHPPPLRIPTPHPLPHSITPLLSVLSPHPLPLFNNSPQETSPQESEEDRMVQCNECFRWVHALCEGIDQSQYEAMTRGTHPVWVRGLLLFFFHRCLLLFTAVTRYLPLFTAVTAIPGRRVSMPPVPHIHNPEGSGRTSSQ